jgi:hypothetical protein
MRATEGTWEIEDDLSIDLFKNSRKKFRKYICIAKLLFITRIQINNNRNMAIG